MRLGFMTAVFPDLTLEEVLAFAADEGFACVEVMCWPRGPADRRHAGATHVDVANFTERDADHVRDLVRIHGVSISGLGYYANPLDPNPIAQQLAVEHLDKVIRAAPRIGVNVVNTFIGRDPCQSLGPSLDRVRVVWPPLVALAKSVGVRIGIEHCPMLVHEDEWPAGKNLATSPDVWRQLFDILPGDTVGLNIDPSHLVWQFIECGRAIREFGGRIVHVHAKDERIDRDRLHQAGVLGLGWHRPKLPGLGDVNWGDFFAALTDVGYDGAVCVEVEDAAFEGSLAARQRALRQSRKFLEPYFG